MLKEIQIQLEGTTVGIEQERFAGTTTGLLNHRNEPDLLNQTVVNRYGNLRDGLPEDGSMQTEIDGSMCEYTAAPYTLLNIDDAIDEITLREYIYHLLGREAGGPDAGLMPHSTPMHLLNGYRIETPRIGTEPKRAYLEKLVDSYGFGMLVTGRHLHFQLPDNVVDEVLPREPDLEELGITLTRTARPLVAEMIALTAASPFYNNLMTQSHSVRNLVFPHPDIIDQPWLYQDATSFRRIKDELIDSGEVFYWPNHLYTPVRPKQDGRIEIRSLDTIQDRDLQMATAVYFHLALIDRFLAVAENSYLDYEYDERAVETMKDNERKAAHHGARAVINRGPYEDGGRITLQQQVAERRERIQPLAEYFGLAEKLKPLESFIMFGETEADRIRERFGEAGQDPRVFIPSEIQQYRAHLKRDARAIMGGLGESSPVITRELAQLAQNIENGK